MAPKHEVVLKHALKIPGIFLFIVNVNMVLIHIRTGTNKLAGKRVILASNSPRRKEILRILVIRSLKVSEYWLDV